MSPTGGDASLTIPKRKVSCYRLDCCFAGVQEGNQCWGGNYTPCTSDMETFYGGKGLVNVFNA
jgi:hypothetical protein